MANIFDYVRATEIAAYIESLPENKEKYLGSELFPTTKQASNDVSWLKGADGLPVAITPSNYDAKATLRERNGFAKIETEMAFFRESMRVGEKDRQEINKLLSYASTEYVLPLINKIFDDVKALTDGVYAQAEYMRMNLLQTGTVTVANRDNTAKYVYDYNMPSSNKVSVANNWETTATSTPIQDINSLADDIEERTGVRPTRGFMNRKTFLDLAASDSIKKDMSIGVTASYSNFILSDDDVMAYLEKKTKIAFTVYNKKIGTLNSTTLQPNTGTTSAISLVSDDKVVLLPPGAVGKTVFGVTPEESDLLNKIGTGAQCEMMRNIAITTIREPHPVNVQTIVSATLVPSFEGINYVGVLTTSV